MPEAPHPRRSPWALRDGEIHVWRASLDRPAPSVLALRALLSEDERARADRFLLEHHRRRFAVCRGLLRVVLGRYLNRPPERLAFAYGPSGKPTLAGPAPLLFNVSHSDELAVYAVARDREISIDVERVRPVAQPENIADHFFSPPERHALRAVPPERRLEAFYDCWTRKEAYVKARGEGLGHPLDQFAVSFGPGAPARLMPVSADSAREIAGWSLQALSPGAGYVGALAARGDGWRTVQRRWPDPRGNASAAC